MKEKVIGKGKGDALNDIGDYIDNGFHYRGGHGTRILIRAKKKKSETIEKDFELTVFNWNPNSFIIFNNFGWTDDKLNNSGEKNGVKHFNKAKNEKTLTIEGTIFNEGIDVLSDVITEFNKEPVISEIQELEKYANSGAIFLLVEPTVEIRGEKVGGKNIGNFYVKTFEYTQSEFIYSNKAQKTVFKVVFTEYNL